MTDTRVFLQTEGLAVTDADKREVSGLALPYGEELERLDWVTGANRWVFEEGAAKYRENSILFYGHDHQIGGLPIGRITTNGDGEAGSTITARISETPKGDEVYTLAKDGVLNRFSIGFDRMTARTRLEDDGDGDPLLVFEEVDVFEVSIVPMPAYDTAVIDSVLHDKPRTTNPKETHMQCSKCGKVHAPNVVECEALTTFASAEDVQNLTQSVELLGRQVATLGETHANPDTPPVTVPGNSYGEFLQLVVQGDTDAQAFLEYVGGVVGDLGDWVKDSWVGDIIREVNVNRIALNFFDSSPLPATGMRVEYGKLLEDTTQVGKQAAEGDQLPFGKIKFTTDSAPLETYGGWGEMSRQQIERSGMQIVDRFFRALIRRYARVTENAVRVPLSVATGAKSIPATSLTTSDGWIDFLVEAAVHYDERGLSPEVAFLGKTAFKDLAKLRDGDNADAPRLLTRDSGTVNVLGLNGTVYSLRFQLLGNLPANAVRVAHSEAIRSFEASGAPWRLQDGDITKLTEAQSIYGYMAVAEQEPDLIVVPGA